MSITEAKQETQQTLILAREALKKGLLPGKIHNDAKIYDLEKEKVFRKAWIFVAHESELVNNGDYVIRYVTDDNIIVTRDDEGKIRGFFNHCSHRGMPLCRSECGSTSTFTCPYHGWVFKKNGDLIGVPTEKLIFGSEGIDRKQWALHPVPQIDSYNGFIFVCLDSEGDSLELYLGDMAWYLDFFSSRTDGGFEVVGPPQRWVVDCDWKLAAENFAGDSYHAGFTHQSVMEIGLHPNKLGDFKPGGKRDGVDINAGAGTMGFAASSPKERGCSDEMIELFKLHLSSDHKNVFEGEFPKWPTRAHLFPNLSFLNAGALIKPGFMVPFLTVRLWRPLGPGKTEIWSWVLVERDAPFWFKEASMKAYVLTFGSSGTEEQDDAENWIGITQSVATTSTKDFIHSIEGGLNSTEIRVLEDWPGPGTAYSSVKGDCGQRYFIKIWLDYVEK